jgi:Cu(I)/Ag(I) efflux system membrane fusion protein
MTQRGLNLGDHAYEFAQDEGGLRPPPGLNAWQRAWWWFDFLILVKLARLRFVAILVVIGVVITQWDTLIAYYDKWTRSAASAAQGGNFEWFCPMHPSIVRDNPKEKCPICFMPLSKRKKGLASEAEPLPAGIVNRVQLSPYRVVLAGVTSAPVTYQPLSREIVASGLIEFNERGQKTVSARVNGRIDKLFANETGQMVAEGDVLASIYSPDLNVTVQNLLQAKRANNQDLLRGARERLELLGIDSAQIDEILRTGQANTHLKIRSPISGHVIQKYVREGQYVQEGMALYDVADLSTVWIEAQVYEDDISLLPLTQVHAGDVAAEHLTVIATTRAFPNEEFRGQLKFIYPHVDQATRTLTVRFEIDNPGHKLRPGSTATVRLEIGADRLKSLVDDDMSEEQKEQLAQGNLLAVPESAVIDTGDQKIVYRRISPGEYEGVRVAIGPRMIGPDELTYFPVLSGLTAGDQVVMSGSFLVDAETRLNPAAGSIYFGGSSGSKGAGGSTVRSTTPEDPDAKITANLAGLSPADRELAESQYFCPILKTSRIGSMGPPVKLTLAGETVFLCCSGCKAQATEEPEKTAARVRELRQIKRSKKQELAPAVEMPPPPVVTQAPTSQDSEEKEIQTALAKLSPQDRELALAQKFCVVAEDSRLGSMGTPTKITVNGQTVFLCCEGCEKAAKKDPQGTLAKLKKLKAESKSTKSPSDGKDQP